MAGQTQQIFAPFFNEYLFCKNPLLSGPAILRLSAFGAGIWPVVNIVVTQSSTGPNQDECFNMLWATTLNNPKK
jgi:hypothetical protein